MKKNIIFLIIILLLTCGCSLTNNVTTNDVTKYLKSKYGNIDFYFVKEDTCNIFELGMCSYLFSEPNLNEDTFRVHWKGSDGKNMQDNYIETLYNKELNNKYNYFINKLNFEYNINVSLYDSCKECNKNLITFDEYYEIVKNKNIQIYIYPAEGLDNNKYFHLKVADNLELEELDIAKKEVEKNMKEKYNFDNMKETISEVIKSNNLNNVTKVIFNMNDCLEDEYMVSCSYTTTLYER